jgi:hypothetical protein
MRDSNGPASRFAVLLVSVYFVALAIVFFVALFLLWPGMNMSSRIAELPPDVRVLLIALTSAGLGSVINGTTSFVDFVGGRLLKASWIIWYLFRPLIGMTTGFVVYAAMRGGILKADSAVDVLNPYAVVAITAVAGFLSDHIVNKLNEYGAIRFRSGAVRADKLDIADEITISAVTPLQGSTAGGTEVVITGSGFSSGAQVFFGDKPATSVVVSENGRTITAISPPHSEVGSVDLVVANPDGNRCAVQYRIEDEQYRIEDE